VLKLVISNSEGRKEKNVLLINNSMRSLEFMNKDYMQEGEKQ
jgi:hypothetical protein